MSAADARVRELRDAATAADAASDDEHQALLSAVLDAATVGHVAAALCPPWPRARLHGPAEKVYRSDERKRTLAGPPLSLTRPFFDDAAAALDQEKQSQVHPLFLIETQPFIADDAAAALVIQRNIRARLFKKNSLTRALRLALSGVAWGLCEFDDMRATRAVAQRATRRHDGGSNEAPFLLDQPAHALCARRHADEIALDTDVAPGNTVGTQAAGPRRVARRPREKRGSDG